MTNNHKKPPWLAQDNTTVEARFMETGLIPTPHYFQQFLICPWAKKALTFLLNSTPLTQRPC